MLPRRRNDLIRELKGWIGELEAGKTWLEEQQAAQQTWIGELERGKLWLEAQRTAWQAQTRHWQAQARHWPGEFLGPLGHPFETGQAGPGVSGQNRAGYGEMR